MNNPFNDYGSKLGVPSSAEEQEHSTRLAAMYGCIVPSITHMAYIDPVSGDVTSRPIDSVLAELEDKLEPELTVVL